MINDTNSVAKIGYDNQTMLFAFWISSHATAAYGNKSGDEGWSTAKQQRQTQ